MQAIPLTKLPTLESLPLQGKRVLLRLDLNDGGVAYSTQAMPYRLQASLPTLEYLLAQGARVAILTHRGRPQGKVVPELSNQALLPALQAAVGQPVEFIPDCIGRMAQQAMAHLPPGKVLLLENTRFHLAEQLNQQPFATALAQLGDILVNEAFASAHRIQASTNALAALLPTLFGRQFMRELWWLEQWKSSPSPRAVLVGGHAVLPKLELLQHCLHGPTKAEVLLLGGVVGPTFLAAKDHDLRYTRVDFDAVEVARNLLAEAGVLGCRVHLPRDFTVANWQTPALAQGIRKPYRLTADETAQDLGPDTLQIWQKILRSTPSVLWFGSVGMWQHEAFQTGTELLAQALLSRPHLVQAGAQAGVVLLAGNGLMQALHNSGRAGPLAAAGVALSTAGGALQHALTGHPFPVVQAALQQAQPHEKGSN